MEHQHTPGGIQWAREHRRTCEEKACKDCLVAVREIDAAYKAEADAIKRLIEGELKKAAKAKVAGDKVAEATAEARVVELRAKLKRKI